jgi:hypothetical protein
LVLDSSRMTIEESVAVVMAYLQARGIVPTMGREKEK